MDSQTLVNVGLVLVFVLVGGVFAATEIALVSLRESQISQMERDSARGGRVAAVARDPNRFLAAVQIGVTVAGFLSAAYGGATLAGDVAPVFERLGLGEGAADGFALVLITLVIAYLSLVLGELVPKRMALQRSVAVSLAVAPVLDRFAIAMRPVIWLLSLSTNALVRLLGGDPHATTEQVSEEELRDLVSTHEALTEQERRMLGDVFAATETSLKEAMRPRGDVVFLAGDLPLVEAVDQVRNLQYSRYPVTGEGFDDVLGFLHVRDLLGVDGADVRRVRDVCRPVLMLPSTRRVLPSVTTMKEEGVHMAIVVDEYGGTDGIVTLEDLVEEVIGDIRDEYDEHDDNGGGAADEGGVHAGVTTLEDFEDRTGIALPDGDYETIAGFVIAQLGRIPVIGDRVLLGAGGPDGAAPSDAALEVVGMAGPRVVALAVVSDPAWNRPVSLSDQGPLSRP
jgi:putative hemolysin